MTVSPNRRPPPPWQADFAIQANAVVVDFGEMLTGVLTGEDGLDPKGLLATAGGLIGVAANHAAFNVPLGRGLQTAGGLVFGPRLDQYLTGGNPEIVAARALLGPAAPCHEPAAVQVGLGQALAFWPSALAVLQRHDAPAFRGQALPAQYWPGVLSVMTRRLSGRVKDRLDPAAAAHLALETARAAGAVDRRGLETVPKRLHA